MYQLTCYDSTLSYIINYVKSALTFTIATTHTHGVTMEPCRSGDVSLLIIWRFKFSRHFGVPPCKILCSLGTELSRIAQELLLSKLTLCFAQKKKVVPGLIVFAKRTLLTRVLISIGLCAYRPLNTKFFVLTIFFNSVIVQNTLDLNILCLLTPKK